MKDIQSPPVGKTKINIHEALEVNEWTRRFGVTRERLIAAVREVGNNATDVEMFLKKGIKRNDTVLGQIHNHSIL